MKIHELRGAEINQLQPGATEAVEPKSTGTPSPSGAPASDQISLSSQAHLLQKAHQLIAQTPEVRPEKVGPLRKAVQEGTYQVDARQVAQSLIAHLKGE